MQAVGEQASCVRIGGPSSLRMPVEPVAPRQRELTPEQTMVHA